MNSFTRVQDQDGVIEEQVRTDRVTRPIKALYRAKSLGRNQVAVAQ